MALVREFLATDMTLVHDGFLIVLATGINRKQCNTCVELKIIISSICYFIVYSE